MTKVVDTDWLRTYHPTPASRVRLVCFPHAGGSASYYFPMSLALNPSVEVYAVQYPGRQDRRHEACIPDIGDLAAAVENVLADLADDVPTAFFGHSMGALVGYETALRLEGNGGRPPIALFASGRRAPSTVRDESVHRRDDAGIVRELQMLAGTDSMLLQDEELLEMFLPAIRNDYAAVENYRAVADAAITAPITVLVGDADPRTTIDEARAWRRHTRGAFELRTFPGGHFYLEKQAGDVINIVSDVLLELVPPQDR